LREHSNFPFSLAQLQGALVRFSWIHVLVWDHDDHLYTLHYLYGLRPRADVPVLFAGDSIVRSPHFG